MPIFTKEKSPWAVAWAVAVIGAIFTSIIVGVVFPPPGPAYLMTVRDYEIISDLSGKCLSVRPPYGFQDGDPVEQWDCNFYHMGLQASWAFAPAGVAVDNYQIISLNSGKCLEVSQASGAIQQSKCTGSDNQTWVLPGPLPTRVTKVAIKSRFSKKCLNAVVGVQPQDGDVIDQQNCSNVGNQLWVLSRIGDLTPPHDSGKGQLCDACDPSASTCQTNGGKCVGISNGRQWVCGQGCGPAAPCPSGYMCSLVQTPLQPTYQCIPGLPLSFQCSFP